ncbi:MAG: hypothetical protein ACREMA_17550 [Longimicrobiales bacterium]
MSTPQANYEQEGVDLHLRDALDALELAMRNAIAAGYGDQFRAALAEATKAVEHTRGMLA